MNNWKEEFERLAQQAHFSSDPVIAFRLEHIKAFIETQIIEKLIEEIPDTMFGGRGLKRQLRASWLRKD